MGDGNIFGKGPLKQLQMVEERPAHEAQRGGREEVSLLKDGKDVTGLSIGR